jgi:hypothetical protein
MKTAQAPEQQGSKGLREAQKHGAWARPLHHVPSDVCCAWKQACVKPRSQLQTASSTASCAHSNSGLAHSNGPGCSDVATSKPRCCKESHSTSTHCKWSTLLNGGLWNPNLCCAGCGSCRPWSCCCRSCSPTAVMWRTAGDVRKATHAEVSMMPAWLLL